MTEPAPFLSSPIEIEPEWIDYNGHLNMGYYTVLFDRATDEFWERLGFGPAYLEATGHTTYAAEFHIRYLREVKLGDRLHSVVWMVDHDAKRLHTFQELRHRDGWLAATGEGMILHVDTSGPKVVPMPADIMARVAAIAQAHARLPRPDGVGGRIGIPRKG